MRIPFPKLGVASLIAVCLSFGLSARSIADEMDGVVRVKSAYGMEDTIARVKRDVADKGIMFFSEINQSEARRKGVHQIAAVHVAGVRQPAARHAVPDFESERRARLAGAALGRSGRGRQCLDGLHGLHLDRAAPSHRRPRRNAFKMASIVIGSITSAAQAK